MLGHIDASRSVAWRKILLLWAGLVFSSSLGPTARAGGPEPPPPNPDDPVDYIKWINRTLGDDVKDNAYNDYVAAFEELKPRARKIDFGDTLKKPWSDNQKVSDWLTANRRALDMFREAAAKPEFYAPLIDPRPTGDPRRDRLVMSASVPDFGAYRLVSKGLIAEGYRAWHEGDHERLPENLLVLIRSAHHLGDNPSSLLQRLIGCAVWALAYETFWNVFALCDDPDSLARKVLPELRATDPAPQPFSEVCRLERLISWDTSQRFFVRGDRSGEWDVDTSFLAELVLPKDRRDALRSRDKLTEIGYENTLRDFNRYFDAVDRWNQAPYHLVAAETKQFEDLVLESGNPLLKFLAPSLTRARLLDERLAAERRATHLIVHLLAYRAKAGNFPTALHELDAPDLDTLRLDPFSGKDFVYKKWRKSFKLYSVAGNQRDDGGKHDPKWEKGDYVFWPVEK